MMRSCSDYFLPLNVFGQLVVMEILRPRAYTKDDPIVFQESGKLLKAIVKTCYALGQALMRASCKIRSRTKAQDIKRYRTILINNINNNRTQSAKMKFNDCP